ncbi:AMSH-like ubiquitin thioesterase 3 [Tanacetum coccineum]
MGETHHDSGSHLGKYVRSSCTTALNVVPWETDGESILWEACPTRASFHDLLLLYLFIIHSVCLLLLPHSARIYREEKNIIDLYVMLLRYSSLVLDTIKFHRDYQCGGPDRSRGPTHVPPRAALFTPVVVLMCDDGMSWKSLKAESHKKESSLSWHQNLGSTQDKQSSANGIQFQKLSLLPPPRQETLSRHSFLGPNGLRGQWSGPSAQIKVQYPTYDLNSSDHLSLIQSAQSDIPGIKDSDSGADTMDSVLSLDDGRWSRPAAEDLCSQLDVDDFLSGNIRQPSPPPVLARLQPEHTHISPAQVADPRPGPANLFQDDAHNSTTYQHLHIPVKMMQDFLRLAQENTKRNLETCGVLAGSLKNRNFQITTLIIPKQESTSDSCQTLNEEDIFDVQDKRALFPLGWIHTHPSQTCFMSSVDLHTHYAYQVSSKFAPSVSSNEFSNLLIDLAACLGVIMLPEAIAIVMAPTDEFRPHGIFHLSDPAGVNLIRNCDQRGFHPHEEPDDGSPIYERCSHVYMNETLNFDVVDLR